MDKEDKVIETEDVSDNEDSQDSNKNFKAALIKQLKDLIPILVIILSILLIKKYVVAPVQVNGSSMDSTLESGDIMILNKISYKIHGIERFDIVVIKTGETLLIKRVIGLPNERIEMDGNVLYINGEIVAEDFLEDDTVTENFAYKTGDNCYFVMGDNRSISLDSRELGCFDISKIQGTTSLTIYPFNRFGTKK